MVRARQSFGHGAGDPVRGERRADAEGIGVLSEARQGQERRDREALLTARFKATGIDKRSSWRAHATPNSSLISIVRAAGRYGSITTSSISPICHRRRGRRSSTSPTLAHPRPYP